MPFEPDLPPLKYFNNTSRRNDHIVKRIINNNNNNIFSVLSVHKTR